MLHWSVPHSWLYYLLLALLGMGVLVGVVVGVLFFLRRSGEPRANWCFGALLLAIAFTQLHQVLVVTGFYKTYVALRYLPLYFTLALPPLLFFHVKFNLYPAYRLRWSDSKHILLPLFQLLFFVLVFFSAPARKEQVDRYFYNPFYGGLEQALYLSLFLLYLYFCYRYLLQRRRELRQRTTPRIVWYQRKLVKGLFVLFLVHMVFVIGDFVTYEFFRINLRADRVFAGLGALSFTALIYWLSMYGVQVLVWGWRLLSR